MITSDTVPNSQCSKIKIDVKCDECGFEQSKRFDQYVVSFSNWGRDLCRLCANKNSADKRRGQKRGPRSEETKIKMGEWRKIKYPSFTKNCKYCNTGFTVKYGVRDQVFCSKSCQVKGAVHPSIKKNKLEQTGSESLKSKSLCTICNTEFEHYGEQLNCSTACHAKYMSEARLGENNPNWIPREELDKSECANCGIIFCYGRSGLHKGQFRIFCSLACAKKKAGGRHLKNREQYIVEANNFDIFVEYRSNPYPTEWNDELREKIRNRDNNCCQLCSSAEKLEVHHIDYIKSNCNENNLVTLCRKCHNITHHNRQFWTQVFIGLNSNSKIVKKGWGLEIHIVNNNNYCLKYLVFFKGKKFSLHKHALKQELWLCTWGSFECFLKKDDFEDYFLFEQGDKIEIMPGTEHQLKALTNCIITEVSTPDYPEDSIRMEKGD